MRFHFSRKQTGVISSFDPRITVSTNLPIFHHQPPHGLQPLAAAISSITSSITIIVSDLLREAKKKKKKREKRKTEKRKNISRVKSLARPTSRTGDGGNLRRLTRDFSRCSVAELRPNCHSSGGPRRIIVRVSAVNRCPPRDTPLKVGERLRRA